MALHRRLFLTLEEGKPQFVLNTLIRDLLNQMRLFLSKRGDDYQNLVNELSLSDLVFLADFTGTLSEMKLELQVKNKCNEEIIKGNTTRGLILSIIHDRSVQRDETSHGI
ncbi:hypothetical protein C0J52_12306 [Blattella germanica]|nr:hypothetical protein C0J52_12306 [Blattella germanica]